MSFPITAHMMICNEDQFVWFAINSVLPYVSRFLIYDTGSTDKTVEIINSVKSPKIVFAEKGPQTDTSLTKLRNEMIGQTKTNWFLLIDGDEVWDFRTIQAFLKFTVAQPKNIIGVFLRTRNCVGDVWHYLPESFGHYNIAGKTGHLNIRAYRKSLKWRGLYPLECYGDINNQSDKLKFFDGYYWHLTHLDRSSRSGFVSGFRHRTIAKGISVTKSELPEVFFAPRPGFVPEPLKKRSTKFELIANVRNLL